MTHPDPVAEVMEPITVSALVRRNIADAFDLFTGQISAWWPLDRFSFGGERALEVHFEAFVGGRFYERYRDGAEHTTGEVLAWDPPNRVIFTWKHDDWVAPTEVEVRFTSEGEGLTRVKLEHRAWERLGLVGQTSREGYANGWPTVVGCYSTLAGAA
jgi:uncharacterized protein YndB with AHSA1/START domain